MENILKKEELAVTQWPPAQERAISRWWEEVIEQRTHRIGLKGIFRHAQSRFLNTERANWVQGRQPPEHLTMSQAITHTQTQKRPGLGPHSGLTFGCINTHMCVHTHVQTLGTQVITHALTHLYTHAHAHTHFHRQTHTRVLLGTHMSAHQGFW